MLEPSAEALGVELVAVEMAGSESSILRVYIDKPEGVDVSDCSKASRQFSALLDVEDPISNQYTLEVSSPGLDRPLVTVDHFQKVVGQKVKIRTMTPINGRRRYKGVIESIDENEGSHMITINVDGEQFELDIADMEKARLVPDFSVLPNVE